MKLRVINIRLRERLQSAGLLLILAISLTSLLLVSCNPFRRSAPVNSTKVVLRLPWVFNIESAGILVAKEKGLYANKGIDLQIQPGGIGLNPAQLVGGGNEDIGIIDGAGFVIARSKGLPIKAVAAEYQKSPFCYITLSESGIVSVDQFRGKRIGTQNISIYVLEAALANKGMVLNDVKMVPVQFDATPLVTKQVDAYLGFITDQPISLQLQGVKTNVIPLSDNGYSLYGNVIFAKESTLNSSPTLIKDFLDATFEGWRLAFQDIPGTAAMIKEKYNSELNVDQQRLGLERIKDIMIGSDGLAQLGQMDKDRWATGTDLLLRYKQIENPILADDIVWDLGYVKK
ncbi:MAG: ABC transporter substrate-binding protein [Pyrinomonadaceae bacterium]